MTQPAVRNHTPSLDTALDERIHRPPAKIIARLLSKTPLTPNQVTITTLVPSTLSGLCFLGGNVAWASAGLLFFYLWAIWDHTDGELARLTGKCSEFGQKLDDLCDNIASMTILCGIFFGMLPFWNEHDKRIFQTLFLTSFFFNIPASILIVFVKRKNREGAERSWSRFINCISGREILYFLMFIVLAAYTSKNWFVFSGVMGTFIIGMYVISAVYLAEWLRMVFFKQKTYNLPS